MGIKAAIDEIAVLQEAMTITEPGPVSVKHVYKYPPAQSVRLTTPCWVNSILSPTEDRPNAGLRIDNHSVRMHFYAGKGVNDNSVSIAAGFYEEAFRTFDGLNRLLGGAASYTKLRGLSGDQEVIVALEWAGAAYAGLELYLDVRIIEPLEV